MRPMAVVLVVATLFAASCGDTGTTAGDTNPTSEDALDAGFEIAERPLVDPQKAETPPSVRILGPGVVLELDPWTTCWSNYCADGAPGDDLDVVVGHDELFVEFPVENWRFTARSIHIDETCGRRQVEDLEQVSETVHRLVPHGDAGTYQFDVSGWGDAGGDVHVSFIWEYPYSGVAPTPAASISILADHDGEVDSYGVEFSLTEIATLSEPVEALVVVTAANGASHSIELSSPVEAESACFAGPGNHFIRGDEADGLVAAGLGPGPFIYEVTVLLDGAEHHSSVTWPDDVDDECRPCIPLSFDPPLPRFEPTTAAAGSGLVQGNVDILTASEADGDVMNALSTFTLEYDHDRNCLYHDEPSNNGEPGTGGRVVIVWPFGYSARADPNGVDVIVFDADGQPVARTGDTFVLPGGAVGSADDHCDSIGSWIAAGPPRESSG